MLVLHVMFNHKLQELLFVQLFFQSWITLLYYLNFLMAIFVDITILGNNIQIYWLWSSKFFWGNGRNFPEGAKNQYQPLEGSCCRFRVVYVIFMLISLLINTILSMLFYVNFHYFRLFHVILVSMLR